RCPPALFRRRQLQLSRSTEARRWRRHGDFIPGIRTSAAQSDPDRSLRANVVHGEIAMNPFDATNDADRHAIWDMLIARDSEAFIAQDWSMVQDDFDAENFEGVRC